MGILIHKLGLCFVDGLYCHQKKIREQRELDLR